jgi:7-keto-8-aminopelargonate synthetase-like enzyme
MFCFYSAHRYGASCSSTRCDVGTTQVHVDLEKKVAEFVGKKPFAITCTSITTTFQSYSAIAY